MKTKFINFTGQNINKIFYDQQTKNGSTNDESIKRMKKILFSAINSELTDKQRLCLIEYYINGKKGKDIAEELALNPSTVSRHIAIARKKLQHIASYYI